MAYVPAGALDRTSNENGLKENLTNGLSEKIETKLYIANLPPELNEDGIKQIFTRYGDVTSILSLSTVDWAYVTYRTHREAVLAIANLDGKPPLNLKVEISKGRQARNVKEHTRENGLSVDPERNPNPYAPDHREADVFVSRNHVPHQSIPERLRSRYMIPSYEVEDDIMYPVESHPRTLNPFENAYPYHNTNLLWTRGRLAVADNGRRQVYMGRGLARYEIPDHHPRLEENISALYDRRSNGLYEYGVDNLKYEIGRCLFCGNITRMRCSKCTSFYCSRNCQKADWNAHKVECLSLPALTGVPNAVNDLQERVSVLNQRKPASQKLNSEHVHEEKESQNIEQELKQKLKIHQEEVKEETQKSRIEKRDIDCQFQKQFLKKDKFIEVEVMCPISNCECWIQRTEDAEKFTELMDDLKASDLAPKADLIIDSMVAYKFYDMWHRAMILSVEPLTVNIIDYGINCDVKNKNDIRDLGMYKNVPSFARKIFIQNRIEDEPLKENEHLFVKLVSENDETGVLMVVIPQTEKTPSVKSGPSSQNRRDSQSSHKSVSKNEPSPKKQEVDESRTHSTVKSPATSSRGGKRQTPVIPKELPCPTGCILDHLEADDKGLIEVHTELGKSKFSITIIPQRFSKYYEKVLVHFGTYCGNASKTQSYTPTMEGEIVAGRRADDDWIRGQVLSLDTPIKVASIDDGRVSLIQHCLKMPSEFAEVCTFAATCSIQDLKEKVESLEHFSFVVLSSKIVDGKANAEIMLTRDNNTSFKADLTQWQPPPEQIGVTMPKLKTNTEIIITAFRSQSLIYVRSLETSEVERYNRLLQEVAKVAQSAQKLKNVPVIGEMILSKYEDNNYYRAVITKIDGDKIFITYIDFGNVEVTTLTDMREMPNSLKQQNSATVRVSLKGVPSDVPMTEGLANYLAHFTQMEQPLKMTFEGSPLDDGVELKTASRESVNEKVNQLLNPNWKEAEKEKTCFMLDTFPCVRLGEKGDTVTVCLLYTQHAGTEYFMCPLDIDLIAHVQETLPGMLQKYVESTTEHYIPREGEMCIAPFEGTYYRAACLSRGVNKANVFFVDYGNLAEVDHKDLRFFPKEFATPPALGTCCRVQNFLPKECEKQISPQLELRIRELLREQTPVSIKIIDIEESTQTFFIEIPEIRSILLKENLF
ncbi:uncharacterized protein LOC122497659 [Leptopilina heterotoma]|uniref:uncharacterized protein LOC122497659 n=1 Tax=Leptopilina heterotoma TaxID=63436 RepID=UPI001CA95D10|nr:uncharacterized protein LOC122497659 [Leptopilina heterotoma]